MTDVFSKALKSSSTNNPIKYAVPLPNTQKEGFSAVYERDSSYRKTKMDIYSPYEAFCRGLRISYNDLCLGTCVKNEDIDERQIDNKYDFKYVWKTYAEVDELVRNFGSAINALNLIEEIEVPQEVYQKKFKFIGLGGINCVEWITVELSANALNCTVIPMYPTLGTETFSIFLNETKMLTVCGDLRTCELVLKAKIKNKNLNLKKFIVFTNQISSDLLAKADEADVKLYTFEYAIQIGKENKCNFETVKRDNVSLICYTSGTTGSPKGVMITNESMLASCFAFYDNLELECYSNDTHISYLPLAHIYERIAVLMVFSVGARIGFYRGNVNFLVEDMYLLKPTIFVSVPRLLNKIYDEILASISKRNIVIQNLFHYALDTKVKNYRLNGKFNNILFDYFIFNKIKERFGGKIRLIVSGSAPMNSEIQEKLSCIFSLNLIEGWGMTETSGPSFVQSYFDFVKGTVGGPTWVNHFFLKSVPELNYFSDRLTEKNTIQGELCVRGQNIFKGYFLRAEETNEVLDSNMFLHSGDIAEVYDNGAIKIIDRKKNIYKLAQGEYVSPEKIEELYEKSRFVAQAFVHATRFESCLVGIIVVDKKEVFKWAQENKILENEIGKEENFIKEELGEFVKEIIKRKNNELKAVIMNDLNNLAENKLMGFEKVKDIYITDEKFTTENGLITPTMKLVRYKCEKAFIKQVTEMFENLNNSRRCSIKL